MTRRANWQPNKKNSIRKPEGEAMKILWLGLGWGGVFFPQTNNECSLSQGDKKYLGVLTA